MLIDKTYFTGKLSIPNLQQSETANPDLITNNSNLERLINEYEFRYLVDVFGFSIAKTILDQLEADGTVKATTDQKYKDLIDGNGSDWLGLRFDVNSIKYSQIANYVYCQYLYENERRLTDLGVTVDTAEKSKMVSSFGKYNDAWREMISMRQPSWFDNFYNNLYPFHYSNKDLKTLFEYIRESEDWNIEHFKTYQNTNAFDI